MKVLCDAIVTAHTNNASLVAANTGGLHRTKVPHNAKMPYVVFDIISAAPRDTFGERIENYTIQFTVYSDTASDDAVDDIATKLMTVYDYATLTVTGYTFVVCRRILSNLTWLDDPAAWRYVIQYEIEMQKS
jgi:hypothetical protein